MKKSTFLATVLGTVSGVLFSLGMCMALVIEFNAFKPGVIMGVAGIILAIITVFIWRKMEHKPKIKLSGKTVGAIFVAALGTLALGVGMCFCLVWENIILGTVIGLAGIVILLMLIPVIKGFKA